MMVALKYIIGVSIFALFAFFIVKSIVSLVATVREWLEKKKSKKSPEEVKDQNVNDRGEETGKEVDDAK